MIGPSLAASMLLAMRLAMLLAMLAATPRVAMSEPVPSGTPLPGDTSTSGAPAASGLELVPGTAADVLAAVRAPGATVTLVNLWATWCVPCREEFPDLLKFWKAYKDKGVALVLVSGDFASEADGAKTFLASQGVNFRTWLKSQKDEEFIDAFDPAWTGALPATFVYAASGERRHSFLGPVTYDSLEKEVAPLLTAKP